MSTQALLKLPGSISSENINRQTAIYHPTLWGNHFLNFASCSEVNDGKTAHGFEELLKQEVRNILTSTTDQDNFHDKLSLIEDLQRLGVAYHFENEIEDALEELYTNEVYNADTNFYFVSLRFRLLRQEGHHIPSSVFERFIDEQGRFKESLAKDVKGMLSLYEASNLAIHGEPILDEALAFTTTHLQLVVDDGHQLGDQISRALNRPIRRNIPRLDVQYCISLYSEDVTKNQTLVKFAKLDFNRLQVKYQKELSSITEWWNNKIDVKKNFPYARDRVVECYFWKVGASFEPQYTFARRVFTKVIAMASIIDDTFDAYGTYEELQLFTDAVQRWDINNIDELPEYMKVLFKALVDVFDEARNETSAEGRSSFVDYAIDEMKKLVRAYLIEAKWCKEGYIPILEEYSEAALVTTCYPLLSTISFLGMGNIANQQVFEWSSQHNYPKIIQASTIICRFMDDIVSHKFEQNRQHVASSVECYMKHHGVSEEEAIKLLRKKISDAWKDTNDEFMKPTAVPAAILTRVLNLSRVIDVVYKDYDGYTDSHVIRGFIDSLLVKSFVL